MGKKIFLLLLVGLDPVIGAIAQTGQPLRNFPLSTIEALGREIWRKDVAAARGADILIGEGIDPAEYGARGWITTEDEQGFLVTYIGVADGEFVAVFDIRPEEIGEAAFRNAEDRRLSEDELTRFIARMTAIRGVRETCSQSYNTVILEDPVDDGWLVYLLAAVTEPDRMPLEGHYRMSISADGTELKQVDKLFGECQVQSLEPVDTSATAVSPELEISRGFDAGLLETDVFLSILYGVNLKLRLPSGAEVRAMRDGTIRPVDQGLEIL